MKSTVYGISTLLVLLITLTTFYKVIRLSKHPPQAAIDTPHRQSDPGTTISSKDLRLVVIFGIMMICFLLAYVPMMVIQIWKVIGGRKILHNTTSSILWRIEIPMLALCSVVNPTIVLLRSQDIQFKRRRDHLLIYKTVSLAQAKARLLVPGDILNISVDQESHD